MSTETRPAESVMPEPALRAAHTRAGTLQAIHMSLRDPSDLQAMNPYAERRVCGFPLPGWQRAFVWTEAQCARFIESAWLGFALGSYTVNVLGTYTPHPLSGLLIDGQQRMRALERYWRDEFPVFGYRWGELPRIDQRRLLSTHFGSIEVRLTDEHALRALYDRMNFGGTPHLEAERALPAEGP